MTWKLGETVETGIAGPAGVGPDLPQLEAPDRVLELLIGFL